MIKIFGRYGSMVLALVLLSGAPAWAKKPTAYLIFPTGGSAGHGEVKESFALLLKGAIAGQGDTTTATATTACGDAACAAAETKGKADYAVLSEFISVGKWYKFHGALIDANTGTVAYEATSEKATPEEIDVVANRLAESLVHRRPFGETLARGAAVEEEAQAPKMRNVRIMYGGAFGAEYPFSGTTSKETKIVMEGGVLFPVDPILLEASTGFRFNQAGGSHSRELTLDLGLRYYFSDKNIAPFVGALVGTHYVNITTFTGKWGFAAAVGGGVGLFRTTRLEMPIYLRYQYIALPGMPDSHAMLGTVGIYF